MAVLTCNKCDKTFTQASNLSCHKSSHTEVNMVTCELWTLESLGNLISAVCSTHLDSNYKEVNIKFKQDYSDLRAIFEITVPNKVHFTWRTISTWQEKVLDKWMMVWWRLCTNFWRREWESAIILWKTWNQKLMVRKNLNLCCI